MRALVEDFVTHVAANPNVNFFRSGKFAKTDTTRLKKHLADFIGSATGGPQKYTGRDMTSVHASMKVTSQEFEALLNELSGSLERRQVGTKERSELLRIASATKTAIVSVGE